MSRLPSVDCCAEKKSNSEADTEVNSYHLCRLWTDIAGIKVWDSVANTVDGDERSDCLAGGHGQPFGVDHGQRGSIAAPRPI